MDSHDAKSTGICRMGSHILLIEITEGKTMERCHFCKKEKKHYQVIMEVEELNLNDINHIAEFIINMGKKKLLRQRIACFPLCEEGKKVTER